jgi:hypothetical protein
MAGVEDFLLLVTGNKGRLSSCRLSLAATEGFMSFWGLACKEKHRTDALSTEWQE